MSYSRRCAEAPVGSILHAARAHPDWEASVMRSGELCVRWTASPKEFEGHYIFPYVNVRKEPDSKTTAVVCYGAPSPESDAALLKLIRSAK